MGIGDWGLGIGDWAQSPIPNPQSWEYFIFDGEINAQKNEIIKNILTKHLESENISEAYNKIKEINNEYKNDIDEMKKKFLNVYLIIVNFMIFLL